MSGVSIKIGNNIIDNVEKIAVTDALDISTFQIFTQGINLNGPTKRYEIADGQTIAKGDFVQICGLHRPQDIKDTLDSALDAWILSDNRLLIKLSQSLKVIKFLDDGYIQEGEWVSFSSTIWVDIDTGTEKLAVYKREANDVGRLYFYEVTDLTITLVDSATSTFQAGAWMLLYFKADKYCRAYFRPYSSSTETYGARYGHLLYDNVNSLVSDGTLQSGTSYTNTTPFGSSTIYVSVDQPYAMYRDENYHAFYVGRATTNTQYAQSKIVVNGNINSVSTSYIVGSYANVVILNNSSILIAFNTSKVSIYNLDGNSITHKMTLTQTMLNSSAGATKLTDNTFAVASGTSFKIYEYVDDPTGVNTVATGTISWTGTTNNIKILAYSATNGVVIRSGSTVSMYTWERSNDTITFSPTNNGSYGTVLKSVVNDCPQVTGVALESGEAGDFISVAVLPTST